MAQRSYLGCFSALLWSEIWQCRMRCDQYFFGYQFIATQRYCKNPLESKKTSSLTWKRLHCNALQCIAMPSSAKKTRVNMLRMAGKTSGYCMILTHVVDPVTCWTWNSLDRTGSSQFRHAALHGMIKRLKKLTLTTLMKSLMSCMTSVKFDYTVTVFLCLTLRCSLLRSRTWPERRWAWVCSWTKKKRSFSPSKKDIRCMDT